MHGLIRDTFHDLIDRKVIWIFVGLTLLGLLVVVLLANSNLQIHINQPPGEAPMKSPMENLPVKVASMFLSLLIFVSAMTSASAIPGMLSRGRIDYYASKPVSRTGLFVGRFSGLLVAFGSICVLSGGIVYTVLALAMHNFSVGVAYVFLFSLLELVVWLVIITSVGLFTSSTTVAIVMAFLFWIAQTLLASREIIENLTDSAAIRYALDVLYWIFPKTAEMSRAGVSLASGDQIENWLAIPATLGFGLVAFVGAILFFRRKEL
jgi:ABC-type transport system involved in multi-copper enzyme maturation permease subunit